MMAGNPSRCTMHPPPSPLQPPSFLSSSPSQFSSPYVFGSYPCSPSPFNFFPDHNQELPLSWSQLLLGGLSGGEEEEDHRFGPSHFQFKKLENWEDQILNSYNIHPRVADVKQQVPQSSNLYGHGDGEFHPLIRPTWSQQVMPLPVSSPRSCAKTLSTDILDFSYNKADARSQHLDQSTEGNNTGTGGVCKKPRVQPSSSQPPLKVRKEKLGDRITALHQLVSPFGKTDTASVLLEAIGYIRFLQRQIEALSFPYLGTASANMRNQQSVQGERNCVFPEDPGQEGREGPNQDDQDKPMDLRSRGLCLVPVSCTQHVGSDNGADYWAPAIGGGF